MLMSAVHKVMWLGRATVFVVGLSVILALVFGVGATAFGADGDFLTLGRSNNAGSVTTLSRTGDGPALRLNVGRGAPFAVDSGVKVDRLNADRLDGVDSTALGVTTKTAIDITGECAVSGTWSPCAPVRVEVPAGRRYRVTVLSSFTAQVSDTTEFRYCPAVAGGPYGLSCIEPTPASGRYERVVLQTSDQWTGAASGTLTVGPGMWTFSTAIHAQLAPYSDEAQNAHTTVLVTDVAAGPPIG